MSDNGKGNIKFDYKLQTLNDLMDEANPFPYSKAVKRAKEDGKNIIGWLCTYVPEEIIHAAGIVPTRITGGESEITDADAYLYANTCFFARSCLNFALNGGYNFLDGIVAATTCDPIRRLFDVWRNYVKSPFTHIIHVPHKVTTRAEEFFTIELKKLQENLESFYSKRITDEDLNKSVALYNRSRSLLGDIYDMRKGAIPKISGTEVVHIMNAAMKIPKEDLNPLLGKIIDEAKNRPEDWWEDNTNVGRPVRLLITGSILDNPEIVEVIESLGGAVVADELCTGSRYFTDLIDPHNDKDIVGAIAKRYLNRPYCARTHPFSKRLEFVTRLIDEYRIDGIIYQVVKFCDLYGHDKPIFKEEMKGLDIPVLELDLEYGKGTAGQLRTRVEAFIEMLR